MKSYVTRAGILPGGLRVEFLLKTTIVAIYVEGGEVKKFGFYNNKQTNKQTKMMACCEPQWRRGFPIGPKRGFWPNHFPKKNLPWVPYDCISFFNDVRRRRRSAAPERLMTDLA